LTIIRAQKNDIRHENAIYIIGTTSGRMQMMANAVKPALKNWYIAKENRRKSTNTLLPLSWVVVK
jgi:hypothetical protein